MWIGILFLVVGVWASFTLSTPESRAAARARHHPFDKIIGAMAAVLAVLMLVT